MNPDSTRRGTDAGLRVAFCQLWASHRRATPHVAVELMERAGHEVRCIGDEPAALEGVGLVWIQGNANWFPGVCRRLETTPAARRPLVVIRHGEPLPPPRVSGLPQPRLHLREIVKMLLRDRRATDVYTNVRRLRRLARHGIPDVLAVASLSWQEFLTEQGIASEFVPTGYRRGTGGDLGLPRDIEAVFLGTLNVPRRKRAIQRLRSDGIDLIAVGSWTDPTYWGEERNKLLNRACTLLNLQRYPGDLASSRLVLGITRGALVVSEPIYRPEPFVPSRHYVEAPLDEMASLIRFYRDHPNERQRIVDEARRFLHEEMTIERTMAHLNDLIASRLGHPLFDPTDIPPRALPKSGQAEGLR